MPGQRIKLEAESAELNGLEVYDDPAASGGKFVGGFDAAGDRLTFRIHLEQPGMFMLLIRYKTIDGDKVNNLHLNGELVANYPFRNAPEWKEAIVRQFPFRQGENVLEIEHSWGGLCIDEITLVGGAGGSVTAVNLWMESGATSGTVDVPVALTALADHAAEYRFWARRKGEEWKPFTEWGLRFATIWTPPEIGEYELKATVRDVDAKGTDAAHAAEAVVAYRVLPEHEGKPLVSPVFSDHMVLQRDKEVWMWGWSKPGDAISVELGGHAAQTVAGDNGRWEASLGIHPAGGPHTIRVSGPSDSRLFRDVYFGDVWLASGQSNMEWPLSLTMNAEEEIARADEPLVRYIRYPSNPVAAPVSVPNVHASWKPVHPDNAANVYATAWFFAREIHRETGVPIGILCAAVGGTRIEPWMDYETLMAYPEAAESAKRIRTGAEEIQPIASPTVMYNGMIHPLIPYRLKGVIWYQGESNSGDRGYRRLLPMWMDNWRKLFRDPEMPYIIIQLAAFGERQTEEKPVQEGSGFAIVREAHHQAVMEDPLTALVVTTDIGDPDDIHPRNKQDVGRRSALAALALCYGRQIAFSGPVCLSSEAEDGRIRIRFRHAESGLMAGRKDGLQPVEPAEDGRLLGFAVAGADGVWHAADAVIDGDSVLVSSKQVPHPVHVRYNWFDSPIGNLYNRDGLPAAPFRTDV